MEKFMIAAFRSRMQVMAFERTLTSAGLKASVVTTPRAVALGCGLSVRFAPQYLGRARQLCRQLQQGSLIGFYTVMKDQTGRVIVRPAPLDRAARLNG